MAALAAAPPLAVPIQTGKATFQLLLLPAIVGADNFALQLMTGEAALLKETEATLSPEPSADWCFAARSQGCPGRRLRLALAATCHSRWPMKIWATRLLLTITLTDEFEVLPP